MAPFRPSFELKQLISLYGENVAFIEGSATCQSDLERVNAAKAAAFFLLADANAEDAKMEDTAQIVRALAVQNFCSGNVRVIVEVLEPATQSSAVWNHSNKGCIEVICLTKIHYKMLSRSCFIRGFYTFVTNLFTYGIRMKQLANNHFFSEYINSFSNSLYPCIFPAVFCGLLFEEVVDFFFTAYNVLLIGLDIPIINELSGQSERTVLLYPKGHFIDKDDVGLVLASNLQAVQSISALAKNELREGIFQNVLDYFKKLGKFNDSQDKLDLLEQVCARWTHEKSRASISRQLVLEANIPDIDLRSRAEPSSPHGHEKLKKHLVNVMYRGLLEQSGETVPAELVYWNKGEDMEEINTYSEDKIPAPQSSIQTAAEELLAWPPSLQYGRPHPAVLERKTDVILKNLGERTISIVELHIPHFLVCCQGSWPNNIYYLLAGLRSPAFPKLPVVILHPQTPSAFQWGSVGIFDDIFFLEGSPLYEVDLLRAGILQSEKVVVLVDQGVLVDISGKGDEEDARDARKSSVAYASDVDNIVIAANIEQIFGKQVHKLIVEMQHATALHYLQPQYPLSKDRISMTDYKRNPHGLVYFTLPYIEGKAVSGSMLGFLLRSTFYNKNTVPIIEQLVDGGPVKLYEGLSKDHIRVLDQIPVPKQHANHPYSDMFLYLLTRHKMLALGLYRPQGTLGSVVPYVHTNPQNETILREDDLVFVLK